MARSNGKHRPWTIRKCNPTSFEVHASGRFAQVARRLIDVIPALHIVKDSPDAVVLRGSQRDSELKRRVRGALHGA